MSHLHLPKHSELPLPLTEIALTESHAKRKRALGFLWEQLRAGMPQSRTRRRIWLILAFCSSALPGKAQIVEFPSPWIQELHEVLAPAGEASAARLLLSLPAIGLDPWMEESDLENRCIISNILDRSSSPGLLLVPSGPAVSSVYHDILHQARLAQSTLTSDQRTQLLTATLTLFSDSAGLVPSPGYRNYLELKAQIDKLQAAWEAAAPENRTATMASDLDEAMQNMLLTGDPDTYVRALAAYHSLRRPTPEVIFDTLRARLLDARVAINGVTFTQSDLEPSYASALASDRWTTVTMSHTATNGIPLTNIWGHAAAPDGEMSFSDSRATSVSLAFDYSVVGIARPWMDASVLSARYWKWSAISPHPQVSDGSTASGGPHGLMPLLPVALILVRDVQITSDLPKSEWVAVQRAILSGDTLAWGPFLVSGHYVDKKHRLFAGNRFGQTLRIPDPQIVGWLAEPVPLSPNPDPLLDW